MFEQILLKATVHVMLIIHGRSIFVWCKSTYSTRSEGVLLKRLNVCLRQWQLPPLAFLNPEVSQLTSCYFIAQEISVIFNLGIKFVLGEEITDTNEPTVEMKVDNIKNVGLIRICRKLGGYFSMLESLSTVRLRHCWDIL